MRQPLFDYGNDVIQSQEEWQQSMILVRAAIEAIDMSAFDDYGVATLRTSTGVQPLVMPVPRRKRMQGNMIGNETERVLWAYSLATH